MAKSEAAEKEEYKNDRVHVVVKRKPHCVVDYEVVADRSICIEAQDKAVKELAKDVQIPGFRKGRAPMEIVAKRNPEEMDAYFKRALPISPLKRQRNLPMFRLLGKTPLLALRCRATLERAQSSLSLLRLFPLFLKSTPQSAY